MNNPSLEEDSNEVGNEVHFEKISGLLGFGEITFTQNIDDYFGQFTPEVLRKIGRNYYLNPTDSRHRFWADVLLRYSKEHEEDEEVNQFTNIGFIIEGIEEGKTQFQEDTLPEAVFNNDDELQKLRDDLRIPFNEFNTTYIIIVPVFNKIALHAREHLHNNANTGRAKAGRDKYTQLVQLFQTIKNLDDFNPITRLTKVRNLIEAELDKPKSDLIANRGGFFGAYKTVSICLNKFGFKHYQYKDRTAISKTDHLLIELLDAVNTQLKTAEESPTYQRDLAK